MRHRYYDNEYHSKENLTQKSKALSHLLSLNK